MTQINRKPFHVHRLKESILLNCPYHTINRLNVTNIKIPLTLSIEKVQIIIKFVQNHKRSCKATVILRKKNKPGSVTFSNFKLCLKINTHRISLKYRIESPKNKPHTYDQLIFCRGAKNTQWVSDSLFNTINAVGKTR